MVFVSIFIWKYYLEIERKIFVQSLKFKKKKDWYGMEIIGMQIKVHVMCLAEGEEVDWKHLTRHQRFVRVIEAPSEMPLAMN